MSDTTLEDIILEKFDTTDSRWLTLIDLDAMFSASTDAIIINRHIDYAAKDYVEQRNALVFARNGELNFVAHCNCQVLTGNEYIGLSCNICHSVCRNDFSSSERLEHNVWLGIPDAIRGVLHPKAYIVLANWLSRKGVPNYIDAIIDPSLELPPELEGIVLDRGHNYFYEHFDELIAAFLHYFRNVVRNSTKRKNADHIEMFVRNYRSVMFCTKLPVMSSVLASITSADGSAEGRQYADASSQIILDAATDLATLETATIRTRPGSVSRIVHRVYKSYISYILDIERSRLAKKRSLIRRHVLGTRLHFSIRAVIIPHTGRYDELYFPWAVSVDMLKLHIIGRLVRKHQMTISEATCRQITALMQHDPLIDEIMRDLIAECAPDFPGLPLLFDRNPSLQRGSIQLLYVSRVKPDVSDKTINISTLVLKDPHADFDGDALNGVLLIEMDAARAYHVMHPSMRIRSTNTSSIGTNISLPGQDLVVWNQMLQSTD